MRYKLLGKTGLRVSEICFGTMTFGTEWGWGADKTTSRKLFNIYTDAGGNFLDTANHYTKGTSEKYLGDFIKGRRQHYVIATKYTLSLNYNDPNAAGNQRKNMVQAVEASLKRLKTDYIDVYWVHAWDGLTPADEVMRAFDDLVSAGKVLYIGVSDTPAWKVAQSNTMAELKGWNSYAGLQIEYSLIERNPERELMPMAKEYGMSVVAWGPLGGGVLTGKYLKSSKASSRVPANTRRRNKQNTKIA
ncbi:MAG: aldo/keto reductase, partial [Bacteroidetes bacterium]|nr:aldo/keto reductase [Bacteroidota bacterium]